jgi:hypothetical protein
MNKLMDRFFNIRIRPRRCVPALLGLMLFFGSAQAVAAISVTAEFEQRLLPSLEVELSCGEGHEANRVTKLMQPGRQVLYPDDLGLSTSGCRLKANLPKGYSVTYGVEEITGSIADRKGCRFTQTEPGRPQECRMSVTQDPVLLRVYKKWIGGSGEEQDVRIMLECESGKYSGFRYINEGSPDGWEISDIHPDGILCNVTDQLRDNFEADIIDCQGLYVLPGKGEECTLLNTKIVKRIEMLNRYGKVIMIVLVLAVGLIAMGRLNPGNV